MGNTSSAVSTTTSAIASTTTSSFISSTTSSIVVATTTSSSVKVSSSSSTIVVASSSVKVSSSSSSSSAAPTSTLKSSNPGTLSGCYYSIDGVGSFNTRWSADWTTGTTQDMTNIISNAYAIGSTATTTTSKRKRSNLSSLITSLANALSFKISSAASLISSASTSTTASTGSTTSASGSTVSSAAASVSSAASSSASSMGSSTQLYTSYNDILYGSVRAVILLSNATGFTSSMSATQEIDYNWLTYHSSYTTNTVSDASSAWHEYRVDWLPGVTNFYVDTQLISSSTDSSSTSGLWLWNAWNSDGTDDSVFQLRSIDAYFNRTSVASTLDTAGGVCSVAGSVASTASTVVSTSVVAGSSTSSVAATPSTLTTSTTSTTPITTSTTSTTHVATSTASTTPSTTSTTSTTPSTTSTISTTHVTTSTTSTTPSTTSTTSTTPSTTSTTSTTPSTTSTTSTTPSTTSTTHVSTSTTSTTPSTTSTTPVPTTTSTVAPPATVSFTTITQAWTGAATTTTTVLNGLQATVIVETPGKVTTTSAVSTIKTSSNGYVYVSSTTDSGTFSTVQITTITPTKGTTATVLTVYPTPVTTCTNTGIAYAGYSNVYAGGQATYSYPAFTPEAFKTKVPKATATGTTNYIAEVNGGSSNVQTYGQDMGTANYVIDHTFYLFARQDGYYSFNIPYTDDLQLVWIGSKAVTGWTRANADIVQFWSSQIATQTPSTLAYYLTTGTYLPVRVMWANGGGAGELDFNIYGPDGSAILASNAGLGTGSSSVDVVRFPCNSALGAAFPVWGSET